MNRLTRVGLIVLGMGLLLVGVAFALGANYFEFVKPVEWIRLGKGVNLSFDLIRPYTNDEESMYSIDQSYSFDPSELRKMDIDWIDGKISVRSGDVDNIEVHESGKVRDLEKDTMFYQVSEGTLSIEFSKREITFNPPEKHLEIVVPRDAVLEEVEIECASAELELDLPKLRELEIDSMSGTFHVRVDVEELSFDSMSGDLEFYGKMRKLKSDTMSGDLLINIPRDHGFLLHYSTLSGELNSDLPLKENKESYQYMEGDAIYDVHSMSGDITIKELVE